jgi:hypothetical protein
MNAKEYNSVLTKIKTDFKKYGKDGIVVSRINESIIEFSNVNWKRKIICSLDGFIQMVKVGYFEIDKNEINLFLNKEKEYLDLKVNETIFLKKHIGKGLWDIVPMLFFISGIIAFLNAIFLYLTNSNSVGFTSYSREGNSLLSSDNSINWFHSFLIGFGLIVLFFVLKIYNYFKSKKMR